MALNSIGQSMGVDILRDLSEIQGQSGSPVGGTKSTGFAEQLQKSLSEVNQLLAESDKKSVDMVSGKSENLHDAMITFEKAETAFKLMVQVRNKALEAYHEIMRMQV